MTEEIRGKKHEEETQREEGAEEEPHVYSVKKGLTGWKFGRREFLTAAATAATAATAAAMAATGKSKEATSETTERLEDSITLAVAMLAMTAVGPAQSFAQVWRFTNQNDTAWCKGARLHFVGGEPMQAPASVPVPDIAPGETAEVHVDMVAPTAPGTYQCNWRLQAADSTLVASGPFVLLNECIVESPHPYENNMSETWTVTNPDTDAQSTRVHFSRVEVESNYDYVILRDEHGQEHQRITGGHPSGLWSTLVPGRVVQVQLVTDSSETYWGFCLDQIETTYFAYLPSVSRQPTPTPTSTPTPTATPCPCHGYCSCNPHCTCDRVHYWYPC
jgi:hypothetical protein